MEGERIILPAEKSIVIAVDPLFDFGDEEGEFVQCYGKEDSKAVMEVIPRMSRSLAGIRDYVQTVLCRSAYEHDQFGIPGLEKLCTTEEGRRSLIDPSLFNHSMTKRNNSILVSDDPVEEWLEQMDYAVLCGLTTTSCIKISHDEIRSRFQQLGIVVPRAHVASRVSRGKDEQRLFEQWSSDQTGRVTVVPSLDTIQFV